MSETRLSVLIDSTSRHQPRLIPENLTARRNAWQEIVQILLTDCTSIRDPLFTSIHEHLVDTIVDPLEETVAVETDVPVVCHAHD